MLDSIFSTAASVDSTITINGLLAALGTALILGIAISLVYTKTNKGKSPSQSFALTLVMLPAVVTIIILLVGSNVARAFSLAGAFSIIRFRSAPGDAKDITYVLFTMAVGLAAGMGYLLYAAIITAALCAVMIVLEFTKFGLITGTGKILKITIPENLDYQNAFDTVFQKYTSNFRLCRVKTADLGSLYELTYSVTTKSETNDKDFIDELRCRNGNLNITLVLDAPSGEL
ncbi:MAG: DUF4956 domain-containing protein [Oscillospiraceae bacterium]|jgi:hypothetical protein|nr:DUF4956 domain-containing protein [Oscillospiraceae bacterium]